MENIILPQVNEVVSNDRESTFTVTPLFPGYGHTIGNSLRRVLLSSLPGAAVTSVKINGVDHEFSTIKGVKEDMVEIILNLKTLRITLHDTSEPVVLLLNAKGAGNVTASGFKANSKVTIANPDLHLATLSAGSELNMELTVEYGRGYNPVEKREGGPIEIGRISIDSLFSPVEAVTIAVQNTRVGKMTNYDELTLTIKTDGTISPSGAFKDAAAILVDQFHLLASFGQVVNNVVTTEVVLDDDLSALGLSAKAVKLLGEQGISTIDQLKNAALEDIQAISGLGVKALAIIMKVKE